MADIIPSVSQILNLIKDPSFDNIPDHILKNKAEFGTNCHNAIKDKLLMHIDFPEELIAPLNSWSSTFSKLSLTHKYIEIRFSAKDFNGCADYVGYDNNKDIVLDWKFKQKISIRDYIQISAYCLLYGINNAGFIHTFKTGDKWISKYIDLKKKDILIYQRYFLNIKELFYIYDMQKNLKEDRSLL